MSKELERIAEKSRNKEKVQNIMYLINKDTLTEEHKRQQNGKAEGIDKTTKTQYAEKLNENLEQLIGNMKQLKYRPQPVRRTYIPKEGSDKLRPLGIPAYEDKLVQGAMTRILNTIYEEKFYEFSYGFRPNKSCHDALRKLDDILMARKANYVVDADIKGFFENVDHKWLIKFIENDIQDKTFVRYISRFLNAGVMEGNKHYETDKGTPQGGVISPILANVYLHYVLDMWFDKEVKKHCNGETYMIRYADDNVWCFQYESEAKNFYEALKKRLAKFGLAIAEDKSKIIKFGRYSGGSKDKFDFLGITHIQGKTNSGKFVVEHRTSKKKLKAKKQAAKKWLKENMHKPVNEIIKKLNIKLEGHYRYYGISRNSKGIVVFYNYIIKQLYFVLSRRSQKNGFNWEKFYKILKYNPVAEPRIYVRLGIQ